MAFHPLASAVGDCGTVNARVPNEQQDLRHRIDELIKSGNASRARPLFSRLWQEDPRAGTAQFIVSRIEHLESDPPVWLTCRVALLRSFTLEPVVPLLRAAAAVEGIGLDVHLGDFNTYAQELLDSQSTLYRFNPEIVILAVQTRDIAPEIWADFGRLQPSEIRAAIDRVAESFYFWVEAFRSRSNAQLLLHSLEEPPAPANGVFDAQTSFGQVEAIREINRQLRRIAAEHAGVYVMDYDALVARVGRQRWHDEEKWLTVRLPIASECLLFLVREWLRFLHPLTGRICKVLVTDLDNVMWGGIVGEDGPTGIQLGPEYPGAVFQELQRAMLDLHRRGILLAICSKNNPSDVQEVLTQHPGMLLRPDHFSATRINWADKAQNLREIAAELNLGTEALAFLDDSPAERELIRSQMAEVTVIDLPRDPCQYATTLRACPFFERLSISMEDRNRPSYYSQERLRQRLQQRTASLDDFYRSLQMEAYISEVTAETVARVAQLTQKTNQFNLTTRRYTEQQIREMAAHSDSKVYTMQVRDRFGDAGLVGVGILRWEGHTCEIDSFLLSCRVIGRTVETALLAFLASAARRAGATELVGWFLPTQKNSPAKSFYDSHRFRRTLEVDGAVRWEFDLSDAQISPPEWIRCHENIAVDSR
jgi:FkbH-like protein